MPQAYRSPEDNAERVLAFSDVGYEACALARRQHRSFVLDTRMLAEFDELERDIAIEVGDWKEKRKISVPPEPPSERVLALAKLPPDILRAIRAHFEIQFKPKRHPRNPRRNRELYSAKRSSHFPYNALYGI